MPNRVAFPPIPVVLQELNVAVLLCKLPHGRCRFVSGAIVHHENLKGIPTPVLKILGDARQRFGKPFGFVVGRNYNR